MMQDASEEKLIGFAAAEKARLAKAWSWSLLYHRNSISEHRKADLLNYLMLILNLVVVVLIVYKTISFPCRTSAEPDLRRMLREIIEYTDEITVDETCSCSNRTRFLQEQMSAADMARYQAAYEEMPESTTEKYLQLA